MLWLRHPETVALIGHIRKTRDEHIDKAASLSSDFDGHRPLIAYNLNAARVLKQLLEELL